MKSILHARSGARTGLRVCLAALLGAALVVPIPGCGGASDGSAAGPHGGAGGGRGPGGGGRPGRGGDGDAGGSPSKAAAPQVPVIVETVGRADMEAFLDASSTLMAEEAVGVVSQATGVAVELLVEEGDRVAEGQTLVRLAYEELELAERAARSDLDKLRADHQRAETLAREDLISDETYQRLRFDFERAEIVWKQRALDLAHTRILAPISGTITERMVNVGQLVQRNETVFRLVDFDSLVAPVFVPEKYLASLRVGHEAVIRPRGLDDTPFDGTILRISPIVDSQSGTVKVTIAIDRRAGLRPGMFANVQIVLDTHEDAVVLSKKALVFEDEQPHVFVVRDGTAQKRQLRLGYQDADRAEVTEGLEPGETVVVVGQSALKDGSAVVVQTGDTENARAAASARAAAAEGSTGTESVP